MFHNLPTLARNSHAPATKIHKITNGKKQKKYIFQFLTPPVPHAFCAVHFVACIENPKIFHNLASERPRVLVDSLK